MTDDLSRYHGSGPWLPGESWHQALGLNTTASISSHLIRRARGGMNRFPAPGHGFEHEPLDNAEKSSQHVAQDAATFSHPEAAASIRGALRGQPGHGPVSEEDDLEPADHVPDDVWVREAMRQNPGYRPFNEGPPTSAGPREGRWRSPSDAWRGPRTPGTRHRPGGSTRP